MSAGCDEPDADLGPEHQPQVNIFHLSGPNNFPMGIIKAACELLMQSAFLSGADWE